MKRFILIMLLGVLILSGCSNGEPADAKTEKPEAKVEKDESLEDYIYKISLNREMHKLYINTNSHLEQFAASKHTGDTFDSFRLDLLDATIEIGKLHPPKELREQHEKVLDQLIEASNPMIDARDAYEEDEEAGFELVAEAFEKIQEANSTVKKITDFEE